MNLKLALIPASLAVGAVGVVALHPGIAHASPRIASGPATKMVQDGAYSIDPMHTSVSFEVRHMGLSSVHGRLNKYRGTVVEDPKDLSKCSVEFTGDMTTVDTAVPPRDEHLRGAEYFDSAKYPELTFKSTKVAKKGKGYVVTGDLTIKGKTKSVSIPFQHYGPIDVPQMGMSVVGVVAEPFTIKRSDFGIGGAMKLPNGEMALGDEVTMRISFEAGRKK